MIVKAVDIKKWLVEQDDYDYQPDPDSIRVMKDPQVRGTFAVRFNDLDSERVVDLLFITEQRSEGLDSVDDVLSETLEEVEYESWPPKSGSLRFF